MTILIFFIVLLVLILVHEFGHFIVAKKSGIRVDEFGVGFPPKLFGKKFGETEYTINLLPFGGFVRIFGENPDEESLVGTDAPRALIHKPKYIQAAVLVAGVFFNILFAWIIFTIIFAVGAPAIKGEFADRYFNSDGLAIVSVLPESPAANAGVMSGDLVVSISAQDELITPDSPEAFSGFIQNHSDKSIALTVMRGSEELSIDVTPETGFITDTPDTPAIGAGLAEVGIATLPIHRAIIEATQKTIYVFGAVTVGIVTFLFDALTLNADLSSIAGPVGIVGLVGDASSLGFIVLLQFTAFISLNLAIINLIPFPALDGGRLLFLGIEAVKGSPIRPVILNTVNTLGFALLILLMLAVTYSDILRIVN